MEGILERKGSEHELAIGSTNTFDELFVVLDTIGSLEGSQTRYSAKDLQIIITDVRAGTLDIGGGYTSWRVERQGERTARERVGRKK